MIKIVSGRAVMLAGCLMAALMAGGCGGGESDGGGAPQPPPPTPAPAPSGNTGIGAAGGTVTEAGGAKVVIPAGALSSNVAIAVAQDATGAPPLPAGFTAFGKIYAFTPHGTSLAKPVTITVPFDPASVPAGTVLALYKTNSTQSAWDVVSGSTTSGGTMSGDVTGFSFATVGPSTGITPVGSAHKHWVESVLDGAGNYTVRVQGDQVGGALDLHDHLGRPLPLALPEIPLDVPTFTMQSNVSSDAFFAEAVAPLGERNVSGARTLLTHTYFFTVDEDHPSLTVILPQASLDAFDDGGNQPGRDICPWLPTNPTPEQIADLCSAFMSSAEAEVRITASSENSNGVIFDGAGDIQVKGMMNDWRPVVTGGLTDHALFRESDFKYDEDTDHSGLHDYFTLRLQKPVEVDIPIDGLQRDDVLKVEIALTATALNQIQGESVFAARLGDPVNDPGIDFHTFRSKGVTPTDPPAVDDLPTTPLPIVVCPQQSNADSSELRFLASSYWAPERSEHASVIVERLGTTVGAVSVHVQTHDGTAAAGSDYQTISTDVRFADGEGGQRRVDVPLVHDDVAEPDETLTLTLGDVVGCAHLGAITSATLNILDDDRLEAPATHTIGGMVSGLAGTGLVLKEFISGERVTPANGAFHFPTPVTDGTPYDVEIMTQPDNPAQSCTIANSTGSVSGNDVTNIQVTCASLAASGSLDPSFGADGLVATSIPFATDVFNPRMGMAIQADGRILLVGGTTLARFNSDGTLDSSFGTGGQVHVPFDNGVYDAAMDVAVQPSGKIVVVGVTDPNGAIGADDFALARFNSNGTLDTTFGTAGKTQTDIAGSTDQARRVLLQPDGKILVTGYATIVASPTVAARETALARYTQDGVLDTTFAFNGSGKVHDSSGKNFSEAHGVALQSDGKIVIAGITTDNGAAAPHEAGLVRYLGDNQFGTGAGQRDESFGTFGLATGNGTVQSFLLFPNVDIEDVAVEADGTILVVGTANPSGHDVFALGTFKPDGELGSAGVLAQFTDQGDVAQSLLTLANGNVVVVGQSGQLGSNPNMAVALVDLQGLGTRFGDDGKVMIDFFGSWEKAYAAVEQADHKIVIGGYAHRGNGNVFALARLNP